MPYEKPEALEIGAVKDLVLGNPKRVGPVEPEQLPMWHDAQVVAEFAE